MVIKEVPKPEVYEESADFRFFIDWFEKSLDRVKFLHENFFDLYDPQRCPEWLVWALADTMGYKFDDRLPTSFNRLVLLYFNSMIHNRGSRDGVMLAAQTNLAQFNILMKAQGYTDDNGRVQPPKEILYNRLEDTSIPVNSVYVSVETEKGYIDVVYFSDKLPLDACIEYVRPVGMYAFQHSGVRFDAKTKMALMDVRLTNTRDCGMSFGPTHVGHYRRRDYATMQLTREKLDDTQPTYRILRIPNTTAGKWYIQEEQSQNDGTVKWASVFGPFNAETHAKSHFDSHIIEKRHTRENVWYRNREGESGQFTPPTSVAPASFRYDVNGEEFIMNPGYRTMYSLQLCNNEQIMKSLFTEPVFSLGYGPQDFQIKDYAEDYINYPYRDKYADGTFEQPLHDYQSPTSHNPAGYGEAVVDPTGRHDPDTNEAMRRILGKKAYNLRLNRNLEEARFEHKSGYHASIDGYELQKDGTYIFKPHDHLVPPNEDKRVGKDFPQGSFDAFDTYSIEGEGSRWYILKNGERFEPTRTYSEKRIAEVRLAIIVPPDLYTTDHKHASSSKLTDLANKGTYEYELERINYPNATKPRPAVNPIMAELGESISTSPNIRGEGTNDNSRTTERGKDLGTGERLPTSRVEHKTSESVTDDSGDSLNMNPDGSSKN